MIVQLFALKIYSQLYSRIELIALDSVSHFLRQSVESVEVWRNCYYVRFASGVTRFVSKRDFLSWFFYGVAEAGLKTVFIPAISLSHGGMIVFDKSADPVYVPNSDPSSLPDDCLQLDRKASLRFSLEAIKLNEDWKRQATSFAPIETLCLKG